MKYVIGLAILAVASVAYAKDAPSYESGTLTNMASAQCGTDENSGRTFVGEVLGTDGAHKKDRAMLCQEYTLETKSVVYHIRPREEKHPVLLPIGETAQFRIKKDKLILKIAELDGKEREYQVISMTARDTQVAADTRTKLAK
jgi:hypothetical protein